MKKQEKLTFLSTFIMSILVYVFALVALLLQSLGVVAFGGNINLMVALGMGFGICYNVTAAKRLFAINKRDIEEVMAYEAAQAAKAAAEEACEENEEESAE